MFSDHRKKTYICAPCLSFFIFYKLIMSKILIIDDEVQIRSLLARMLGLEGYEVCQAGDCKAAIRQLEIQQPDVALCDVFLPDGNGVDLVLNIKKTAPNVEVILLTAHGNIPDGVQAIKNGAFDYITKGDDNNKIIPLISRAVEKAKMNVRLEKLEKKVSQLYSFDSILGESKVLKEAVMLAQKVSVTDVPVLLTGETGTGKEVFAQRQGFEGIRWMKMTDPSGMEAPSNVGSFLIWQQPHLIYLAELLYRANPSDELIKKYNDLIQKTAEFMYSFAVYDKEHDRYILKGAIPAQETLRAADTVNPPFELSYWLFGMQTAQTWRERAGMERVPEWDTLIEKLSPLAYNEDKLYLAAETAVDTYKDIRFTSDHMAVLGAVGILPMNKLVNPEYMKNTLNWVWDNWNWNKTWGWDYPMTAMDAARLGEPEKAVGALLMDKRTNTYLVNGHNYQDGRLRVYLPGNGGLLTAVAMMCAGWDGSEGVNPGFPKDGKWNVRWEGLKPLP